VYLIILFIGGLIWCKVVFWIRIINT
jgi:hypothetical protein